MGLDIKEIHERIDDALPKDINISKFEIAREAGFISVKIGLGTLDKPEEKIFVKASVPEKETEKAKVCCCYEVDNGEPKKMAPTPPKEVSLKESVPISSINLKPQRQSYTTGFEKKKTRIVGDDEDLAELLRGVSIDPTADPFGHLKSSPVRPVGGREMNAQLKEKPTKDVKVERSVEDDILSCLSFTKKFINKNIDYAIDFVNKKKHKAEIEDIRQALKMHFDNFKRY